MEALSFLLVHVFFGKFLFGYVSAVELLKLLFGFAVVDVVERSEYLWFVCGAYDVDSRCMALVVDVGKGGSNQCCEFVEEEGDARRVVSDLMAV